MYYLLDQMLRLHLKQSASFSLCMVTVSTSRGSDDSEDNSGDFVLAGIRSSLNSAVY